MLRLLGSAKYQTEFGAQRSKFIFGRERKINLEGAGQEKGSVNPSLELRVEVVYSQAFAVHMVRPV